MSERRRRSGSIGGNRPAHGSRPRLVGQSWFRGTSAARRLTVDRGDWRRRLAAGIVGALAAALVVVLAVVPAFAVGEVEVTGQSHLSADQVVSIAGLDRTGSIFTVDPAAIESRIETSPWVRSATVRPGLPGHVSVQIEEWQPVAIYRAGAGDQWLLSSQAVALGPAGGSSSSGLLPIQGPSSGSPSAGRRVLDVRLLVALVNIQRQLPALIGQVVSSFQIDGCGNVTLLSRRGWKAQFGRVLTTEELASLGDKVRALQSAASKVNYDDPNLDYVNVEQPTTVAVMTKTAERAQARLAIPTPIPLGTPRPTSTPAPSPTASPNTAGSPGASPSGATGPVPITPTPGLTPTPSARPGAAPPSPGPVSAAQSQCQ